MSAVDGVVDAPAADLDPTDEDATVDPALLRVITRVAHREHLHAPAIHARLAHTRFTRRRPVTAPGAATHRTRGTTARKVIWS